MKHPMQTEQAPHVQQPLTISAKELAKVLGVSLRQIWRLNSTSQLPKPFTLGGSVRWNRDEILRWVEARCPDRRTWGAQKAMALLGSKGD